MREVSPNSVLLVDDSPYLRHALSTCLQEAGFEIRQAADGIEGLVKLRNVLPKVIVSDIQMPRMAGIEFISVVRRRFPCIPVIGLTISIPAEVPAEAKPDVWFQKGALNIGQFLQTLGDLVRKTPDRTDPRQVVTAPVRTRPTVAGHVTLTCMDCLRTFEASMPEKKARQATAVCSHCEALVPFVIESSAASKGARARSETR